MKMPNIAGLFTVGKALVAAHRPEILFGTSVVTTIAGMVAAGRAGYKSGQQVLEEEMKNVASPEAPFDTFLDYYAEFREKGEKLGFKEKAQLTWINYLPSAGLGLAAVGATTGLHIVHVKEKKQMAAVALMAIEEIKKECSEYVEDYKEAVEGEVKLTDAKRQKIDNAILEKNADRNNGTAFIQGSDGEIEELYLVRDAKTGRDIWSNERRIDDALLRCNELLMSEGNCDLNTFYSFAGMNTVPDGDREGWSGDRLSLEWSLTQRDDGRPVKSFTFRPAPVSARG